MHKLNRIVAVALFLLAACGNSTANHSFEYGAAGQENQGVEIIAYQYGDSKFPETYDDAGLTRAGHIGQQGRVHGVIPVGEFLYVKWKVLKTGRIYEDKVDLKGRLPNMEDKRLRFLIKEDRLYVYVITDDLHDKDAAKCPVEMYDIMQCQEIYPQHWTNY